MTILAFYLYESTVGRLIHRARSWYWDLRDYASDARGFFDWWSGENE
jgi:hypothetical protein